VSWRQKRRFRNLCMAAIVLELGVMLWIAGGIRPL